MVIKYIESRVEAFGKTFDFFFHISGTVTVAVIEFMPYEHTYLLFDKFYYPPSAKIRSGNNLVETNWIESKIEEILAEKEFLQKLAEYRQKQRLEHRPTWVGFLKYWAKLAYKNHDKEEARKIVHFLRLPIQEKDRHNAWNATHHVYMNRPEADILNVFKTIVL